MPHQEPQSTPAELFALYRDLRLYVGWTDGDAARLQVLKALLEPSFAQIIDDFYEEIARHRNALRVITGGEAQIARLKQTLRGWLGDLFTGPYDEEFVMRRFRVGQRHVEIGLDQFYTNVAVSRIRGRLLDALAKHEPDDRTDRDVQIQALNRILDLDVAIIDFAYHCKFSAREQQQERLATLGRVSGGIAHELRNPLNAIKTSVYYLLNARNAPAEKTEEHLERINRQIGISDSVITALSRFAKLPTPVPRPVDLCDLVEQTLDANPLPDNVELVCDHPEDSAYVAGDQEQLVIVLGNLIRNACDAMPDGGELTLKCRKVPSQTDGQWERIELSVSDTGCGIEADILQRILEPLFSTKTRGIGLGLALAQAIIERHNGELKVASEPGRGSTFTIALNTSEDSA